MEPITSFHRSVKQLFNERLLLRHAIDALEHDHSPYANSKVLSLWERIHEVDRQIGVAYYWHQIGQNKKARPEEEGETDTKSKA